METRKIIETRRGMAIGAIDKIEWEVEKVDCDAEYGDTHWQWHVTFVMDVNGIKRYVGDDYFHKRPDDVMIYNCLLSCIKDGSMGDTVADILTQEGR